MSTAAYWVHIDEDGLHLGAGVLVTRTFVLTALHCLAPSSGPDATLGLRLPDGRRLRGRVCDRITDVDLALIAVQDAHAHDLPPAPPTDRPRADVAWRGSYRPPREKTLLSGWVTHAPTVHRSDADGEFTGLQLTVDQLVHDFAGYSGSPVDVAAEESGHGEESGADGEGGRALVGLLMEQELSRADGSPDTNVAYAASLLDAMERFPYFDLPHLRDAANGKPVVLPGPRPPADVARPTSRGQGVDGFLRRLRQLLEDDLITPEDAAARRDRALDTLEEQFLRGSDD
ncbi:MULTISPECIES: serine protease [unclassified Streptomyces]|uniref:S1 family peptidase n=1 Tax=unclassified Streptomyces TaxID=2593676 RepID=UPI00278C1F1D|nr:MULTISPECIES: serine protease [unclassified Streptomyces]